MPLVEVTFARATKIWWSILWRTWVLMIVPWLALVAVMYRTFSTYMTPPPRGAEMISLPPPHFPRWLWFVSIVVLLVIQILALRWAVKDARWSDFQLQAVSEPRQ